jgi:hypothetical protein
MATVTRSLPLLLGAFRAEPDTPDGSHDNIHHKKACVLDDYSCHIPGRGRTK